MEIFLMLSKIYEGLIAPCLAQIFQLCEYGQYGMHGRIINVPNSFNLVQNVLAQMSYDDFSIYMKIIRIQIYIYFRLHSSKT